MNELACMLRAVSGALSTVKIIDVIKNIVIAGCAMFCGFYVIRLWKKY